MPISPRPIAPELLVEARRLYEQTNVPVRDIAAMVGLAERTLYSRIWKWRWRMRKDRIPNTEPPPPPDDGVSIEGPPIDPSSSENFKPAAAPPAAFSFRQDSAPEGESVSIAVRLQRAIERQMAATERLIEKLSPSAANAGEVTKAAESLACLARLSRELQTINAAKVTKSEGRDDKQPRSDDELRAEFIREIEAALAAQQGEDAREAKT